MSMSKEDNNLSDNFRVYKNKKSILNEPNINKDNINLANKSLNTESCTRNILAKHTSQAELFGNELYLSVKNGKIIDYEFTPGTLISNIKYNYFRFQIYNTFYLFYNQLSYKLAQYFTKSKIINNNIDKFLLGLLILSLTEKLFY